MIMTAESAPPVPRMTDRRVAALRAVDNGVVDYDAQHAVYFVDGLPVSGWTFRTFAELRRAQLLAPEKPSGTSGVKLTPAGVELLRSLPVVTQSDSSE